MSEREWKPGDVAVAIISWKSPSGRHGGTALALRCSREYHESHWVTQTFGEKTDECVTGVRPLVVIDPEDREQVERLGKQLFGKPFPSDDCPDEVERLQKDLREFADPKPPKPEEPTGLGAVVEDAVGTKWIRHDSVAINRPWLNTDDCETRYRAYDEIGAVRVLSEGVQP